MANKIRKTEDKDLFLCGEPYRLYDILESYQYDDNIMAPTYDVLSSYVMQVNIPSPLYVQPSYSYPSGDFLKSTRYVIGKYTYPYRDLLH